MSTPDLRRYWPGVLAGRLDIMDRLVEAYDDPGRAYHDRRHLTEVLERVDVLLEADPRGVDRDAVLLAAWFHDAVYDTGSGTGGDNEERSATLAERELRTARLPPPLVEEVARLVRLTTTHRAADADHAGRVLCDADLGILAADEIRYGEYARGVREEYAAVAEPDFRAGRARVLRELMAAPTLFATRFAKRHWEDAARVNLEAELAGLEAPTDRP